MAAIRTRAARLGLGFLNLIAFLATVAVNGLANALPINGKGTGELSDQYPNLFVPAGLTFSIWGVIYILLAIYAVYQLVAGLRRQERAVAFFDRIGLLFFVSSLANIAWILAWHYEIVWAAMILMAVLLLSLLAIYLRLRVGVSGASTAEKLMVHLPFSVYLGWITVATVANATALLVDLRWDRWGLSEPFWAVALIAAAVLIALAVLGSRRDIFYTLVVDWALLGILLKRLAVDRPPIASVRWAAAAGLALLTLGILVQVVRRKVY